MLVSHEVPLSLLPMSRFFNDYDYCLAHLYEKLPEYKQFYINSVSMGREVMLDNSAYELRDETNKTFDMHKFVDIIRELKPTVYIVPDSFNDMDATIDLAYEWLFYKEYKYKDTIPGKMMGVAQGSSLDEIIECYKELEPHMDIMGISFGLELYQSLVGEDNKTTNMWKGRLAVISELISSGVLNKSKPHHLLGCSNPVEMLFYKDHKFIRSIDSSNPILAALNGTAIGNDGLADKPKGKLEDYMFLSYSDIEDTDLLYRNVMKFKEFAKQPIGFDLTFVKK